MNTDDCLRQVPPKYNALFTFRIFRKFICVHLCLSVATFLVLFYQGNVFGDDRDDIIQMARDYRTKDISKRTEIANDCLKKLKIYGSVEEFVAEKASIPVEQLKIVNSMRTPFHGKTPDTVYFIYQDGALVNVVKVFKKFEPDCYKFLREVSTFDFILQGQYQYIEGIQPVDFGCLALTTSAMLLESAAKGQRVDRIGKDVKLYTGKKREKAVKQFSEAIYHTGCAFAEINRKANRKPYALSSYLSYRLRGRLKQVLKNEKLLTLICQKLDPQKLNQIVEDVITKIPEMSFKTGYCHGDAHLGNMFYDEQSKKISLIDSANMYFSYDENLQPCYCPTKDFDRIFFNIILKVKNHVTPEEIVKFQNDFKKGYLKVCATSDKFLVNLFFIETFLDYLIKYYNYNEVQSIKERYCRQVFFNQAIDFFIKFK